MRTFPLLLLSILLPGAPLMAAPDSAPDSGTSDTTSLANPQEIRRGVPVGGADGKSREQLFFERTIRRVEPDLVGRPDRLSVYLDLFRRDLINDPNLFATDVRASLEGSRVLLEGHVMFQENHDALLKLFRYLGFQDVESRVEVLPSAALGDRRLALVTVPQAFSYDKPTKPRETVTDSLLGDLVFLLKPADGGYYLVAAVDGYIGYVDGVALRPITGPEATAWRAGRLAILRTDYRQGSVFLPAGAQLPVESESSGTALLRHPGGDSLAVPADVLDFRDPVPSAPMLAALRSAERKLGTTYVWGGKTSEGVDCSGLVQSAYKSLGINLPRDAYQQAYVGNLVATRWEMDGLRQGDLLYFLGRNGRIDHTAIYVGNGIYVEASGDVRYTSFNPEDPNYDERRHKSFCFAKRLAE